MRPVQWLVETQSLSCITAKLVVVAAPLWAVDVASGLVGIVIYCEGSGTRTVSCECGGEVACNLLVLLSPVM